MENTTAFAIGTGGYITSDSGARATISQDVHST